MLPVERLALAQRIDPHYLEGTLRRLVQINSINPSLVPGAPGEEEIAFYVADQMRRARVQVETLEPVPGRPSVLARLRGEGRGRSLLFHAHLDTVGVEQMEDPFSGTVAQGRLYGRGSYDMKGGLAACMAALKALAQGESRLAGDVLLAAVADEEYASLGTGEVLRFAAPDAAIVTEPTGLDLCLAHKGFAWIEVRTLGQAAHGSRFDLGIDANLHMGRFLAELDRLGRALRQRRNHPLLGPPSLHAARLEGGTGWSTYAAECRLRIERRTLPGEDLQEFVQELQQILERLQAEDPSFRFRLEVCLVREPFETSPSSPIARTVMEALEACGRKPRHCGQNPWMDAALLAGAGIDTVVLGPAGDGAHGPEEWVDLSSVAQLAEVLVETALHYCQ